MNMMVEELIRDILFNIPNNLGLPSYTNHHHWSVKQPLLIWFIWSL